MKLLALYIRQATNNNDTLRPLEKGVKIFTTEANTVNRAPRIVIQKSRTGRTSRLDTSVNYKISGPDGKENAIFHLVFTHISRKTINHRLCGHSIKIF